MMSCTFFPIPVCPSNEHCQKSVVKDLMSCVIGMSMKHMIKVIYDKYIYCFLKGLDNETFWLIHRDGMERKGPMNLHTSSESDMGDNLLQD